MASKALWAIKILQVFFKEIYNADLVVIPPYKFRPILGNENSQYICKELQPIIVKSEHEWISEISSTCIYHANCGQGVLIICPSINNVKSIYEKISLSCKNKEKFFTYTGETTFKKHEIDSGEIIVATNIAGRGTDITNTQNVEKAGGMHVCVAMLPNSNRVELQNIGRTARQGKKGTGQLIVLSEKEYFDIEKLKSERAQGSN